MNVQVWNDGNKEYTENFNNKMIKIPPGQFIEMSRAQAKAFLGTYTAPSRNDLGTYTHEKRLRIVEDPEIRAERLEQPERYKCEIDGKMFRTEVGLKAYVAELEEKQRIDALVEQRLKEKEAVEKNAKKTTRSRAASGGK